jgi:hypothetical protein
MTGVNGDYYLDLDSGNLYMKVAGSWALQMNIMGPKGDKGDKGDTGDTGAPGVNGAAWLNGHGAPT